jgi:hypothetical protein
MKIEIMIKGRESFNELDVVDVIQEGFLQVLVLDHGTVRYQGK